jgi:hypothetical protein
MSINKLVPKFKQIKTVRKIRRFHKPTSVFANWNEDTDEQLNKAFEADWKYMKLSKFIFNPQDIEDTKPVFRKYYYSLKN